MRDKSGRFLKGYSGNAGGRPRDEHNIAELARSYSTEAIETLVELMRGARDDRVRGTAPEWAWFRRHDLIARSSAQADRDDSLPRVWLNDRGA